MAATTYAFAASAVLLQGGQLPPKRDNLSRGLKDFSWQKGVAVSWEIGPHPLAFPCRKHCPLNGTDLWSFLTSAYHAGYFGAYEHNSPRFGPNDGDSNSPVFCRGEPMEIARWPIRQHPFLSRSVVGNESTPLRRLAAPQSLPSWLGAAVAPCSPSCMLDPSVPLKWDPNSSRAFGRTGDNT
jgi:hypothetical protein